MRVKKPELLAILRRNRDRHARFFKKAHVRYRGALVRELQSMIRQARKGKLIRKVVTLSEPEDHTREYDRVVRMIEMSIDDTIELDEQDFTKYVLDDWAWKRQFLEGLGMYLSADEVAGASIP